MPCRRKISITKKARSQCRYIIISSGEVSVQENAAPRLGYSGVEETKCSLERGKRFRAWWRPPDCECCGSGRCSNFPIRIEKTHRGELTEEEKTLRFRGPPAKPAAYIHVGPSRRIPPSAIYMFHVRPFCERVQESVHNRRDGGRVPLRQPISHQAVERNPHSQRILANPEESDLTRLRFSWADLYCPRE